MRTRLRLFLDWGITFGEPYRMQEHGQRKVYYADSRELETAILKEYPPPDMALFPRLQRSGPDPGKRFVKRIKMDLRYAHESSVMGYFSSIYAAGLPHRAVAVYMYLKDRTNKEGACWPSIKTIARELKLSRATVYRALDDLCRAGFLTGENRWRENGGKTSNLYKVK